jgi:hypothetical protein
LLTVNPALCGEGDGTWDPEEFTANSGKKVGWRCSQGHGWVAAIDNRSKGSGCPSCARGGFDPNKEGWLYLMRNEFNGAMQIGISNVIEKRLRTHELVGYETIDVRGPQDGLLTIKWECSIKKYIASVRDPSRKIPAKDKDIVGEHVRSGSNETWYEDEFSVGSLWELMELVKDSEELVPA